jgi:predicted MFS family arabinose efflux permease
MSNLVEQYVAFEPLWASRYLSTIVRSADGYRDEQSVGGALFQTSCQIGSALGNALSSLLLTEVARTKGDLLAGTRASYWFSAGVAFVGELSITETSLADPFLAWQSCTVWVDSMRHGS